MRVLLAVLLSSFLVSCQIPTDNPVSSDATPTAGSARPWRLVYIGWDDNELSGPISRDIDELVRAGLPEDLFHCIVIRDTVLQTGRVEVIRRGEPLLVSPDGMSGRDLFDSQTLVDLRGWYTKEFPAAHEVVVIAAHGRGWRGIGSGGPEDRRLITAGTLPNLFGEAGTTENMVTDVVVFDVGYGGTAELLYGLKGCVSEIVTSSGPRGPEGLDLQFFGAQITVETDQTGRSADVNRVVSAAESAFVQSGAEPVVFSSEDLVNFSDTVRNVALAGTDTITNVSTQNEVQNNLLASVVVPTLPGDAFIPFGAVADAVGINAASEIGDILLHLVHLDEIGSPDGHDITYNRDEDNSAVDSAFRNLPWAPSLTGKNGFLFDLWYRRF
ncbi:MAG: clostripain-related cysteine peptidase [Alkalispirochaeta sp.]